MDSLWTFYCYLWTMAGAESPPGRPGFIIQPLKPDNEVPGGGRQTWLKKDDSK